jgi:hypothetical protein
MLRWLRNLCVFCSAIVLAGCQQPSMHSVARQQPSAISGGLFDADTPDEAGKAMEFSPAIVEPCALDLVSPENPNPPTEPVVASVQKEPESSAVQLGDDFVHLLKIFSGR